MNLVPATFDVSPELEDRIRRIRLLAFDFDGVFTDNAVYVTEEGRELVRCTRMDGIGLRAVERIGVQTVIVSTETNPVVTKRATKLAIRCIQGCEDKRATIDQLAQEMQISLNEIAFVGNDVNDLPCLEVVGLPIIVKDAHPDVRSFALYETQVPGGHGAVREVCDLFVKVRR